MSERQLGASKMLFIIGSIALLIGSFVLTPFTTSANTGEVPAESVELTAEEQERADKLAEEMITMQAISIAIGDEKRTELMTATENGEEVSIEITNEELQNINKDLNEQNVELLPDTTKSLDVTTEAYVINTGSNEGVQLFGFWGTTWQITKCAGYLAVAIVPASSAFKAVRALGGMRETAKLLIGAGNATDFIKIAGGVGAEIVGIDGVMNNCTF